MMKLARVWAGRGLLALLCLGAAACQSTGGKDRQPPIPRGPVPPYAQVAEAYNARVVRLERLACPVDVSVRYKDNKGNPLHDQVDANLQISLPANVAMRLDKVGQTVFYLGSNQTRYWWFDLTDEKTALVGAHDRATPDRVASFGLPVHPLDLLEVLAVKPIPNPGSEQATRTTLAWTKDGHYLILTLPGRWQGARRLWLDPASFDPQRVELLDKAGAIAVSAALSRYAPVEVDGDATVHPRVATDFQISLPLQAASVSLRLAAPKNPGDAQKPRLFDLDFLLTYYRIQKVIDVDAPRPAAPRQAAADGNAPK